MRLAFLLLVLIASACGASTPQPEHPVALSSDPKHDGSSCARAIMVDAQDEFTGALKEHTTLHRAGLKVRRQELRFCDGKKVDVFQVEGPAGTASVYFDISQYYGKLRH